MPSAPSLLEYGSCKCCCAAFPVICHFNNLHRVLWSQVDSSKVLTVEEGALRVWDVLGGSSAQQVRERGEKSQHDHSWYSLWCW